MSLKAKFLATAQLRTGTITVDGATYTLREPTSAQFSEYAELQKTDDISATAHMLACSVLDENGELMLTVDEARAAALTGRLARPILQKVLELSGLGEPENKPLAS